MADSYHLAVRSYECTNKLIETPYYNYSQLFWGRIMNLENYAIGMEWVSQGSMYVDGTNFSSVAGGKQIVLWIQKFLARV